VQIFLEKNNPLVSVIMPAFNSSATIGASIDSVLAQTYTNWELIVVNDASSDNTHQIIQAYTDKRIKYFQNEINSGVATTRNKAMELAQGQFFAFLDSDDLWASEKLEKQLNFMQKNNAIISYTQTKYMNSTGKISKYTLQAVENFTYSNLLRRNLMSCSSVIVRRENMLPFPQGYLHEDMAVWLQIIKKAGLSHGLNEPLLIYRLGEATKSSGRIKSAKMIFGTYKEVGFGFLTATFLMLCYSFHSISKRMRIRFGL